MINQLLKLGALITTGRFLKPRLKGLLGILAVWLVLWFLHSEFISYVELSGDTRFVLHVTVLKLALYALSIGLYVMLVEKKLWPKPLKAASPELIKPQQAKAARPAVLPAGDDGFDFLRHKKALQSPADGLLKKEKN